MRVPHVQPLVVETFVVRNQQVRREVQFKPDQGEVLSHLPVFPIHPRVGGVVVLFEFQLLNFPVYLKQRPQRLFVAL